jgi:Xaa-Pro dipeptidase
MQWANLRHAMAGAGLDGLVAVSPENVVYSSGARLITQKIARQRIAAVVLPQEGDPVLLVGQVDESLAREQSRIRDVRTFVEQRDRPALMLASLLQEKGLQRCRVGIELQALSAADLRTLEAGSPGTSFIEARGVFEQVRRIKRPEEVALLGQAAQAARKAVESAFAVSRPGDTERQIAARIARHLFELGADELNFLVLGAGRRSRSSARTWGRCSGGITRTWRGRRSWGKLPRRKRPSTAR